MIAALQVSHNKKRTAKAVLFAGLQVVLDNLKGAYSE